jgi:hypothetical protein
VIWNIRDNRKHPYRWKAITAILELVSRDNSCPDSDQADEPKSDFSVHDQKAEISLADAVIWAQSQPFAVTLYLYDLGDEISVARKLSDPIKSN